MSESPSFEPDRILEALERHGVRYVVVGGFAATLRGSLYATVDVDVTPERTSANLKRLVEALRELDARLRVGAEVERPDLPLEPATIERFQNLALVTAHGNLDICLVPDGTRGYGDLRRAATREQITETLEISVAALADIIRSKQAANREKDRVQLPTLRLLLEREQERKRD